MINRYVFLALCLFAQTSLWADTLNLNTLAFLSGNWKGQLVYTDYTDDKEQVTLETFVSFAQRNDNITAHYTYLEPNGTPVYHTSRVGISKKKNQFRFDDEGFNLIQQGKNHLLLLAEGTDNDRKATIRKKLEWNDTQLTITKSVKYEGTDSFFVRNVYRLTRETDDQVQTRLLETLLGNWVIDLRPAATDAPYLKDFVLSNYDNKSLSGIFYDTPFKDGKIHTDWGKIYFSFTTSDQSGTYFHSGVLENGQLKGMSFAEGRSFLMPWFGEKKQ